MLLTRVGANGLARLAFSGHYGLDGGCDPPLYKVKHLRINIRVFAKQLRVLINARNML